jgi:hypothetical protein
MKHIINATLVSVGLSVASSAAWAQFAPTMDAAAVQAEVQKQLAANTSEEAIIKAAADANISPESLIQALTASVPAAKLEQVVALLAKQFAANQPALNVLATSAQARGLSAAQTRNIIVASSPASNFALAGVGGNTPSVNVTPVNSLFNSNSPASGSGSGAPASAN